MPTIGGNSTEGRQLENRLDKWGHKTRQMIQENGDNFSAPIANKWVASDTGDVDSIGGRVPIGGTENITGKTVEIWGDVSEFG